MPYLSRIKEHPRERWVDAREAFSAATEGGATALGLGNIRRLAPGYEADLVLLDAGALHYVPANDVLRQIVFGEDGSGVDSVHIAGRLVLDRGRFTTIDVAALRRDAEAAVARLREAGAPARALAKALEPYVARHGDGLAFGRA